MQDCSVSRAFPRATSWKRELTVILGPPTSFQEGDLSILFRPVGFVPYNDDFEIRTRQRSGVAQPTREVFERSSSVHMSSVWASETCGVVCRAWIHSRSDIVYNDAA